MKNKLVVETSTKNRYNKFVYSHLHQPNWMKDVIVLYLVHTDRGICKIKVTVRNRNLLYRFDYTCSCYFFSGGEAGVVKVTGEGTHPDQREHWGTQRQGTLTSGFLKMSGQSEISTFPLKTSNFYHWKRIVHNSFLVQNPNVQSWSYQQNKELNV